MWYNTNATQLYILQIVRSVFCLLTKTQALSFYVTLQFVKSCVAAIGVMCFLVRSFGCALFYFKGDVIMGFLKEFNCAACGKKTNILIRKKLTDGNYICRECLKKLPYFLRDYDFDLDTYEGFIMYINLQQNTYRRKFRETQSYISIHLDTEHSIFYLSDKVFGSGIDDTTLFLKLEDVEEFELIFSPDTYKEGTFGDKLKGKVLLRLRMSNPEFYYETTISYSETAKIKKNILGSKITIIDPPALTEFLAYFNAAHDAAIAAKEAAYENDYDEIWQENNGISELKQAMALFMLDSLENITIEELKNLRNRLIKTFHPDLGESTDTKYAQRINNAYETIKNHLT